MHDGLSEVHPRLWRYCVALTGRRDWADDLAQATCLRALEKAHLFEPDSSLAAWTMRMAQRLWLNELRARRVREGAGMVPVESLTDHSSSLPSETNIFAAEVFSKINQLPEAQRVAVLLVYVEGFRYAEAAKILDVPIGTIMSRLAAARRKLSDMSETPTRAKG